MDIGSSSDIYNLRAESRKLVDEALEDLEKKARDLVGDASAELERVFRLELDYYAAEMRKRNAVIIRQLIMQYARKLDLSVNKKGSDVVSRFVADLLSDLLL